jgi:hypothetical protein
LLNRVVVCDKCGRNLRAQSTHTQRRYYRETSKERGLECEWSGTSVRSDEIDGQIAELVSKLHLPENWREQLKDVLEEASAAQPDPEGEKRRLRAELRRLRESYRRGLYEGEEYLFWREVEGIQERIEALENLPPTKVERAAQEILSLQTLWESATKEERSELTHMVFEQVGCDIPEKRITWVKPHPEFEVLFQMLADWERVEDGRYWCSGEMLGLGEGTKRTERDKRQNVTQQIDEAGIKG